MLPLRIKVVVFFGIKLGRSGWCRGAEVSADVGFDSANDGAQHVAANRGPSVRRWGMNNLVELDEIESFDLLAL